MMLMPMRTRTTTDVFERGRRWAGLVMCLLGLACTWGAADLTAQTLSFTPVGSIAGPIDLVDASGASAYVTRGGTLTVWDITDPAAPVRRGAQTFPEQIWGFTVVGSTAYVAAGHSGLFVLDLSDPERPAVHGSITTPGQAKNVAVSGGRAVVADHMSGIDVIDLTDVTAPVSLGSFYTDGYARDVAMFGTFAYGVDNPSGFYVLDLEPPGPARAARHDSIGAGATVRGDPRGGPRHRRHGGRRPLRPVSRVAEPAGGCGAAGRPARV